MDIKKGLKKSLRLLIYLTIGLSVIFICLYIFLNSPYPAGIIERLIRNQTGMDIDIGYIAFAKSEISVRGVLVKDSNGEEMLSLPSLYIRVSYQGLLRREIDNVEINRPRLYLQLQKEMDKKEWKMPSLPVSFKKVFVNDGNVVLGLEDKKPFLISSINLFIEQEDKKRARVKGDVFLDEFNAGVPLDMVIDLESMGIEEGHLEVALMEVGGLSNRKVEGSMKLTVDLSKKDVLIVRINARYQNLRVYARGGTLNAGSGELNNILTISGDYQIIEIQAEGGGKHDLGSREDTGLTVKGHQGHLSTFYARCDYDIRYRGQCSLGILN